MKNRIPGFDGLTDGQKVAITDYAYNRGVGNVSKTSGPGDPPSVLEAYKLHQFPEACNRYVGWAVVKRQNKWVDCSIRSNNCYGIYTRRLREKQACLGE